MLFKLVRAIDAFCTAWNAFPYTDGFLTGATVQEISRGELNYLRRDPGFIHTGYYARGESLLKNEVGYINGVRYVIKER